MTTQENFVRLISHGSTDPAQLFLVFYHMSGRLFSSYNAKPDQGGGGGCIPKPVPWGWLWGGRIYFDDAAPVFGRFLTESVYRAAGETVDCDRLGWVTRWIGGIGLFDPAGHPESVVPWAVVFLFVDSLTTLLQVLIVLDPGSGSGRAARSASGWLDS